MKYHLFTHCCNLRTCGSRNMTRYIEIPYLIQMYNKKIFVEIRLLKKGLHKNLIIKIMKIAFSFHISE